MEKRKMPESSLGVYPAATLLLHRCVSGTKASAYFGFKKSATTLDIRYTVPTRSVPQSGQIPRLLGEMRMLGCSGSGGTSSVGVQKRHIQFRFDTLFHILDTS